MSPPVKIVADERVPVGWFLTGQMIEWKNLAMNPTALEGNRIVTQIEKEVNSVLPTESAPRKAIPLTTGVLDYFPAALVEVAKVSVAGNEKHNPGQPMHHARSKSTDHADSIARHLLQRGSIDPDTGTRHSAELAWRALANLQQEMEDEGAPLARGAVTPERGGEYQEGYAAAVRVITRDPRFSVNVAEAIREASGL